MPLRMLEFLYGSIHLELGQGALLTFSGVFPEISHVPGVFHAIEIPFVMQEFDNKTRSNCTPSQEDINLAHVVGRFWGDFARFGVPHGWPLYTSSKREVLKLDFGTATKLDVETGYLRAECDAFSETGMDVTRAGIPLLLAAISDCTPGSGGDISFSKASITNFV